MPLKENASNWRSEGPRIETNRTIEARGSSAVYLWHLPGKVCGAGGLRLGSLSRTMMFVQHVSSPEWGRIEMCHAHSAGPQLIETSDCSYVYVCVRVCVCACLSVYVCMFVYMFVCVSE